MGNHGWVIGYLCGQVRSGMIVAGGVGYRVECPHDLVDGENVELWVECTGNDGLMRLFGFADNDQRQAFVALTKLPGVGPAAALALLRDVGMVGIVDAVRHKNPEKLLAAKGVGRKLANAITVNLDIAKLPAVPDENGNNEDDLYDTLVALGYSDTAVRDALAGLTGDDATVLAAALDRLNKVITS